MLRMIFPGIPARTFATSFFSGAYQERKLWFDVCVCIRILSATLYTLVCVLYKRMCGNSVSIYERQHFLLAFANSQFIHLFCLSVGLCVEQFYFMLRKVNYKYRAITQGIERGAFTPLSILQVSSDSVVSRSRNYFLICHLENTNCVLNFLYHFLVLPLMESVKISLRFSRQLNASLWQ